MGRRVVSVLVSLAAVAVLLTTSSTAAGDLPSQATVVSLVAGYALLLSTSGYVVAGVLGFAGVAVAEEQADTGRAVGKIENVLILTLTLVEAYTALGLVFTAKSIVRWQDISSGNTTYYLTGSVANVTYSLVYGVVFARIIG